MMEISVFLFINQI